MHLRSSADCVGLQGLARDHFTKATAKLSCSPSESSEDNESNTSPQYQNGSCLLTSDDSSDQASRESSTPELKVVTVRQRRDSCGSLEVLPNNSPALSEGPLSPGSPMSQSSNKQTSPSGPLSSTSQKPLVGDPTMSEEAPVFP